MKASEVERWVRRSRQPRHREAVPDRLPGAAARPINLPWLWAMSTTRPHRAGEPPDGRADDPGRLRTSIGRAHVEAAARKAPSLAAKRVTPHVLRHSCAMHTLAATGDIRKVALWLGHASIQSTEHYLRADPTRSSPCSPRTARPRSRPAASEPPSDRTRSERVAALTRQQTYGLVRLA